MSGVEIKTSKDIYLVVVDFLSSIVSLLDLEKSRVNIRMVKYTVHPSDDVLHGQLI